jgi:hypothetical protein
MGREEVMRTARVGEEGGRRGEEVRGYRISQTVQIVQDKGSRQRRIEYFSPFAPSTTCVYATDVLAALLTCRGAWNERRNERRERRPDGG